VNTYSNNPNDGYDATPHTGRLFITQGRRDRERAILALAEMGKTLAEALRTPGDIHFTGCTFGQAVMNQDSDRETETLIIDGPAVERQDDGPEGERP